MTKPQTDPFGRRWAGSKALQETIGRQILDLYDDIHRVDLVGAVGSVLTSIVLATADGNFEVALAGVEAIAEDMRETVLAAQREAAGGART